MKSTNTIKASTYAKTVFVGMSGGVDSSVSAALLKEQGYTVTGVFINSWYPDWLPCEWKEERRDAMRVAAALDIPFITLDLQEEYKKEVVDYMLEEYKKGKTPNPDVMCNKEIKFGAFLKKAKEMGADYVATSHYAQNKNTELFESQDKNKDQSYFLWTLTHDQLKHILFPVGNLQKEEVRKLAKKFKLPTAEKKDSQGICFLGKIDMKEFLSHYIESKPGIVLDEKGSVIGTHDGSVFYTIGERHSFTISKKTAHDKPYYVISKDLEKNTITVSQKEREGDTLQAVKKMGLENVNWITKPESGKKYGARIRYRQAKQECELFSLPTPLLNKERGARSESEGRGENWVVAFSEPQDGVSVGQSVVIYDGEKCIGGGVIHSLV